MREPRPLARDGRFTGFAPGSRATVIPSAFFTEVLPSIEDEAELRVSLYLFYALGRRRGYPRFVTRRELAALAPLAEALSTLAGEITENLDRGLQRAVARQSFLALDVEDGGESDSLFFLNTPGDRRALEQVREGMLRPRHPAPRPAEPPSPQRENVFQLYEENIGPITPLIAEELREAERLYPAEWLEEALREAAVLNKRSWRYASRILERWATEGRQGEKAGRDPGADDSIRGRIIRRFNQLAGDS